MFTTKITPSNSFAGSFDLEVYFNSRNPVTSIPCHNYATAKHLSDRLLHGDRSEPQSAEDRTGLTAEIVHGDFYGSYTVLVFDEANIICNAIPCSDIRTARHYKANPSRFIS